MSPHQKKPANQMGLQSTSRVVHKYLWRSYCFVSCLNHFLSTLQLRPGLGQPARYFSKSFFLGVKKRWQGCPPCTQGPNNFYPPKLTAFSHLKTRPVAPKRSSSSHPFSGVNSLLVSRRVHSPSVPPYHPPVQELKNHALVAALDVSFGFGDLPPPARIPVTTRMT